eukprot:4680270-Pyramimonas_sp.AAC.1
MYALEMDGIRSALYRGEGQRKIARKRETAGAKVAAASEQVFHSKQQSVALQTKDVSFAQDLSSQDGGPRLRLEDPLGDLVGSPSPL